VCRTILIFHVLGPSDPTLVQKKKSMFRSNIDGVALQGRNGAISAMYNFNIQYLNLISHGKEETKI
jgi:hypothetical protein